MARTSKALFAGMLLLAVMYLPALAEDIRAQTAAGAVTRDSGANIQELSASGLIYAAKENQPICGSAWYLARRASRARPKDFATHLAIDERVASSPLGCDQGPV